MSFKYSFPAVRGRQANQDYYITMVPLKLLSRLFPSDEESVPPEFRAQRRINEARIPEIRDYILTNRNSYVFSALSASIDGSFSFVEETGEIGSLVIDMDSVFLINDGQHRKAAIEAAIQEDSSLGDETISIVFFADRGLARSQQMFTDLNKHAVKTSNSLATLYDSRDSLAVATRYIIQQIPFFCRYTDKERDILGKNSSNLFTLNSIYKANQKVLHSNGCNKGDREFLLRFWGLVANNITEWNDVMNNHMTKRDLRENFILTLSITLIALGRLGRYFYDNPKVRMEEYLSKLAVIDWHRTNPNWRKRTIGENGKVLNSEESALLTCAKIKELIGIALTRDEMIKEKQIGG